MARVLEFYSGIGGLRYSLEAAGVEATVVEAFEINELANDVYESNFGHRPNQGNIQRLTDKDLESYKADAWLLSPPCQPYTRQGLQKDSADARASSFLKLLDMIPFLSAPPSYIFIENVVGFETSDTRSQLMKALSKAGFEVQECILNPLEFGIPYSRPRYFCLAKRKPYDFIHPGLCGCLVRSLSDFSLDYKPDTIPRTRHVGEYLEESQSHNMEQYLVPSSVIERWGDAFGTLLVSLFPFLFHKAALDIVTPESTRCCCFTKSYSRYAKGTGSILVTDESCFKMFTKEHQDFSNDISKASLLSAGLRYFSPREVANFHAFPESFDFPVHISTKQRYALLGNSLNIQVVAHLLRYLFSS